MIRSDSPCGCVWIYKNGKLIKVDDSKCTFKDTEHRDKAQVITYKPDK